MSSHRKSCKSVAPVLFAEHRDRQAVDTLIWADEYLDNPLYLDNTQKISGHVFFLVIPEMSH